jgi:hypothetical protein
VKYKRVFLKEINSNDIYIVQKIELHKKNTKIVMQVQLIFTRPVVLWIVLLISFDQLFAQEIGLQLYSLRNEFKKDVPGTLAKIKEWKIKQIEGGGTYGLPVDQYKSLLQQNNLQMVSYGAGFEELAANPQKVIDDAKVFGFKIYNVCMGSA